MSDNKLTTKYRPTELDEVIGQGPIVRSLKEVVNSDRSHTFLFTGPSGTGKTTLARITATLVGCARRDIQDIDAATHTGIEDMRRIQLAAQYRPLGKSTARAIIIDECHRISSQAWDSLLKITEEPPKHLYWFFCTTNPAKVPNTLKTRAMIYTLKPVEEGPLTDLLQGVLEAEKIKLHSEVVRVAVSSANGSPRQALTNLTKILTCKTRKEAAEALRVALESEPIIELARLLLAGGKSWPKAHGLVLKLQESGENAEGVRIVILNYLSACMKSATKPDDAVRILGAMTQFATPFPDYEKMAPLWLAIGQCILAD